MKLRSNKIIERESVNYVRNFFESIGCVFQEIDTGNDYGKDAYVDFGTNKTVTGLCFAIQIKSGKSYKRNDNYFIPLDIDHIKIWKESTIPLIGIVYDPDSKSAVWINISVFLKGTDVNQKDIPKAIDIPAHNILNETKFRYELIPTIENFNIHFENPIIQLFDKDYEIRKNAMSDCFAIGRSDPRIFVALRYLFINLEEDLFSVGLVILTHLTPHPDIWWSEANWIPELIKKEVKPHFNWTEEEIYKLLKLVQWDKWERGNRGEDLYMLLIEDDQIKEKMENVTISAMNRRDEEVAWSALYLSVYWAGDNGLKKFKELVQKSPNLLGLELSNMLQESLLKWKSISLFE
jgi:hypothetical protein